MGAMNDEIGPRVRESILALDPPLTHRDVSSRIGMMPDAFSRSLNGQRAFSSIELAELAEVLGADLHYLITGSPDPNRVTVAARHDYDDGKWSNHGQSWDQTELDNITLAYRQVYAEGSLVTPSLPGTAHEMRATLGNDFVRDFIDRLEMKAGIDVVRIPRLSTTYSLSFGPHKVIALRSTPNWFNENWALAHELGHLALGHLGDGERTGTFHRHEMDANAFAAELLMPADELRPLDWTEVAPAELSDRVWGWGVSSKALFNRLRFLRIRVSEPVHKLLAQPTQRLLRDHWLDVEKVPDQITWRMESSAKRRFPYALQEAHYKSMDTGRLGPDTLSWMLNVDPSTFSDDLPEPVSDISDDDLIAALGI